MVHEAEMAEYSSIDPWDRICMLDTAGFWISSEINDGNKFQFTQHMHYLLPNMSCQCVNLV